MAALSTVCLLGAAVPGCRHVQCPRVSRPTAIVRTGPYRFRRNPIYLAFSLVQLGIAVWMNSWWLIATLAAAVAIINWVVVPRGERYLERKFGVAYLDYKASARRWL